MAEFEHWLYCFPCLMLHIKSSEWIFKISAQHIGDWIALEPFKATDKVHQLSTNLQWAVLLYLNQYEWLLVHYHCFYFQDILHTIFSKQGQVLRIVIFRKSGLQAMVEYPLLKSNSPTCMYSSGKYACKFIGRGVTTCSNQ